MSKITELKDKLEKHRDTDCLDIETDIDVMVEMAEEAETEFDELSDNDEMDELKNQVEKLEDEVEEVQQLSIPAASGWGLLGVQIVEEVNSIMNNPKTNQIKFLEMLIAYNKRRS